MRVDDLIGYGLSRNAIECLHADGLKYLLPIQQEAIKHYRLLDGKSLLVSGPTSSGKTLCGELASLSALGRNRKAVILTPLKAIAFEKYNEFRRRYRKLKLRILIVSADFPENKERFRKGEYDLAIVVYEMFNALTVTSLAPLESIGVVVFDEFQMVATADRGLSIESILVKVRYFSDSIQLVALIGGLTDCRLFEHWLRIPLLNATNRPVELHRGTLFDRRFSYCRYNDCSEGIEYFAPESDDDNGIEYEYDGLPDELRNALKYLTANAEQALVFVASRKYSCQLAQTLAQALALQSADRAIDFLTEMPDSMQKAELIECLRHGVAFHNADLSLGYREVLEDSYRAGEIKVMVCTSTLAMGVNLPSRNVFIEPEKYYDGVTGQTVLKPLQVDDYNQIAGRAGRLGLADDFGRAVIIAGDATDCENIRQYYLNQPSEPRVALFDSEKLAKLVLSWISCGLVKDNNDTRDLLKAGLRGYKEGFDNIVPTRIIAFLNEHGFIALKGCRFTCTDLGKAAVTHNLELDTAAAIRDGFKNHKLTDQYLSWLYYLMEVPECYREMLSGRYYNYEDPIIEYVRSLPSQFEEISAGPLAAFIGNPEVDADIRRAVTLMLLADMIQPLPTIELEEKYHTGWGRLKRMGEFYANLLYAIAEIAPGYGVIKTQTTRFKAYAQRLYHGVPADGLPLVRLHIRYFERDYILRLIAAGLRTPADIATADYELLTTIIPSKLATVLQQRCQAVNNCGEHELKPPEGIIKPPLEVRKTGQRYEVTIAGRAIMLQPRLYKYLQKLYNADHPDGWVDKIHLESGPNQVKYIYLLRKELEPILGLEIEADGAGRYRLWPRDLASIAQRVNSSPQIG
jgi:helicase